jgi:hypothetical protein
MSKFMRLYAVHTHKYNYADVYTMMHIYSYIVSYPYIVHIRIMQQMIIFYEERCHNFLRDFSHITMVYFLLCILQGLILSENPITYIQYWSVVAVFLY